MERPEKRPRPSTSRGEDAENLANVDSDQNIIQEEAKNIVSGNKQPAGAANVDKVNEIFQFANSRYHQRQLPSAKYFGNPSALKFYQQESLAWMLNREGYYSTTSPIDGIVEGDWQWDSKNYLWINRVTGVKTSETPVLESEPTNQRWPPMSMSPLTQASRRLSVTPSGGILADEMGLGKTIQMIALIATHRKPADTREVIPSTVVVVPLILLSTWEDELTKWAPKLNVLMHYGDTRLKDIQYMAEHDVILTTYKTFKNDQNVFNRVKFGDMPGKWWRIVLDEGHQIKNPKSQTAQALYTCPAVNRWVMTGTPIQNEWMDFYSLLKFLHVRPYGEFQAWMRLMQEPLTQTDSKRIRFEAEKTLKALVSTLVLRRTKKTPASTEGKALEEGDLIIIHPDYLRSVHKWGIDEMTVIDPETLKKHLFPFRDMNRIKRAPYLVYIPDINIRDHPMPFLHDVDQDTYTELATKGLRKMVSASADVPVKNALEFLLRLRQATVHPWLIQYDKPDLQQKLQKVTKDTWQPSTKLQIAREEIEPTKRGNQRDGEKTLIFSQFTSALDLMEVELKLNGWRSDIEYEQQVKQFKKQNPGRPVPSIPNRYVRIDGSTSYDQREEAMRKLREDSNVRVALLSLMATGVGLNLISANNVIFLDLPFNPQVMAQAIARTHRIGQTKPVKVTILAIKDTVDEKMLKLLKFKESIVDFTLAPPAIGKDQVLALIQPPRAMRLQQTQSQAPPREPLKRRRVLTVYNSTE